MCQGGEGAWIASRKMILAVVVLTLAVTLSGGADAKAFAVHEGPADYWKRSPGSNFYDGFSTKRAGAKGFHEGIFDQGFGGFSTLRRKRRPEMTSRGIHSDAFTEVYKRRPEMDINGFYGDTFNDGFGDFYTSKRQVNPVRPWNDLVVSKRLTYGLDGFHGDTFSNGFGEFHTAKKRRQLNDRVGKRLMKSFHGDTFSDGFGDFETTRKRKRMIKSFHGDTFDDGFGDFSTV